MSDSTLQPLQPAPTSASTQHNSPRQSSVSHLSSYNGQAPRPYQPKIFTSHIASENEWKPKCVTLSQQDSQTSKSFSTMVNLSASQGSQGSSADPIKLDDDEELPDIKPTVKATSERVRRPYPTLVPIIPSSSASPFPALRIPIDYSFSRLSNVEEKTSRPSASERSQAERGFDLLERKPFPFTNRCKLPMQQPQSSTPRVEAEALDSADENVGLHGIGGTTRQVRPEASSPEDPFITASGSSSTFPRRVEPEETVVDRFASGPARHPADDSSEIEFVRAKAGRKHGLPITNAAKPELLDEAMTYGSVSDVHDVFARERAARRYENRMNAFRHSVDLDREDSAYSDFTMEHEKSVGSCLPSRSTVNSWAAQNLEERAMQRGLDMAMDGAARGLTREQQMAEFTRISLAGSGHEGDVEIGKAYQAVGLNTPDSMIQGTSIRPYPYQVIGIQWMVERESGNKRGGMLCDEMGLGKTCQMIALMALNPPKDHKRKTNLIIVPVALLTQWKEEIEEKCGEDTYSILVYHRNNRAGIKKADLMKYDVVLTTYQTMAMEWYDERKDPKSKRDGPLFECRFHRIILDEAQVIRNRHTRASKACVDLNAKYRWALSGTPLVNWLSDAYAYFRFTRCGQYVQWEDFSADIARYQKRNPKRASQRLSVALRPIMIRREKTSTLCGKPILQLTERTQTDDDIVMSPEEREVYDAIQKQSQIEFNRFLKQGTVLRNYHVVLTMLLYLRMACVHPGLAMENSELTIWESPEDILKAKQIELDRATAALSPGWVLRMQQRRLKQTMQNLKDEKAGEEPDDPDRDCPICMEPIVDGRLTACAHAFCSDCIGNIFETPLSEAEVAAEPNPNPNARLCPCCRTELTRAKLFALSAFEPSDETIEDLTGCRGTNEQVDSLLGEPDKVTGLKSVKKGGSPCKSKAKEVIEIDSDDDLPSLPTRHDFKPKIGELKSEGFEDDKENVGPARKNGKARVIVHDSDSELNSDSPVYTQRVPRKRKTFNKPKSKKSNKAFTDGNSEEDSGDSDLDAFIVGSDESDPENPKKKPTKRYRSRRSARSAGSESEEESVDLGHVRERGANDKQHKVSFRKFLPSAKMRKALIMVKALPKGEKCLIISQFTSALDLMGPYLEENGIRFTTYDGRMTLADKDIAVSKFKKKDTVKVMLLSLRAGGVGLNLVVASHVFNLDPAYNVATENQAFDRVHRIGQTKSVYIHRLIVRGTVEDRMLGIQAAKSNLINGAISGAAIRKTARLTVRDLAVLFGVVPAAGDEPEAAVAPMAPLVQLPYALGVNRRAAAAARAGIQTNANGEIINDILTPVNAARPAPVRSFNGVRVNLAVQGLAGFDGLSNL